MRRTGNFLLRKQLFWLSCFLTAAILSLWLLGYAQFDEYVVSLSWEQRPTSKTSQVVLNNRWGRLWVQYSPSYPLSARTGHTASFRLDGYRYSYWLYRVSPLPAFRFEKAIHYLGPDGAVQTFYDFDIPYWSVILVVGFPPGVSGVRYMLRRRQRRRGFRVEVAESGGEESGTRKCEIHAF
jgi:hypothetical protein